MNKFITCTAALGAALLAAGCQHHPAWDASIQRSEALQVMAAQSPAADPLLPTPPVALAQPLTRVWVLSVAAVGATADPDLEQQILELREQLGQWHYIEWIEVIGHTDSLGSEDYNQQLSVQRADRVAEQLILAGFDERSIAHIGVGESQPAADNGTQQGRADNRRVEIRVTGLGPWSEDAEVALAPR